MLVLQDGLGHQHASFQNKDGLYLMYELLHERERQSFPSLFTSPGEAHVAGTLPETDHLCLSGAQAITASMLSASYC